MQDRKFREAIRPPFPIDRSLAARWALFSSLKSAGSFTSAGATKIKTLSAIFLGLTTILGGSESPSRMLTLENVSLVDVRRGEIVGPRTVVVVDGRIAAIGTPETIVVPESATRVDGRGRYLMPGLVDMHVHLFNRASGRPPNEWAFPLFVARGVTGVREMACGLDDLPRLRNWETARAEGRLISPRVLAAGVVVAGASVADVREQVRQAHAAGANFVKVFSNLPAPEWRAVMAQARTLKIPVCGHVPREVRALEAARAGQRSDEHLTQLYEACSTREASVLRARRESRDGGSDGADAEERAVLESFDPQLCVRTATALAKTKQVQVPTLVLPYFEARGSTVGFQKSPFWHNLRRDEQVRWERILRERRVEPELASRRWEVSRRIVRALHAAGARILAGTDAPMPLVYPGAALHQELELLVESGLSPADALRAATIWPAEFLGIAASSGSVAVGKRADLLLLDANPLQAISNTQRIESVVLAGRLLRRAELQALLEQAPNSLHPFGNLNP